MTKPRPQSGTRSLTRFPRFIELLTGQRLIQDAIEPLKALVIQKEVDVGN